VAGLDLDGRELSSANFRETITLPDKLLSLILWLFHFLFLLVAYSGGAILGFAFLQKAVLPWLMCVAQPFGVLPTFLLVSGLLALYLWGQRTARRSQRRRYTRDRRSGWVAIVVMYGGALIEALIAITLLLAWAGMARLALG